MKSEGLFYETYLLIYLAKGLARDDACLLRALGVDAAKVGLVVEQARCLLADRAQSLDDRVADRRLENAVALTFKFALYLVNALAGDCGIDVHEV